MLFNVKQGKLKYTSELFVNFLHTFEMYDFYDSVTFGGKALTLCFVIAPTISGHTMPDKVPTPLEMPIRILA